MIIKSLRQVIRIENLNIKNIDFFWWQIFMLWPYKKSQCEINEEFFLGKKNTKKKKLEVFISRK
jgi:hypothetical protein